MKLFAATTCIFLLSLMAQHSVFGEDIETDEGVLVLTKDNFEKAVADNEFILVEFYAPWCGHCKALAPEYVKAAQTLAENHPNIKLAKVDATLEGELAESHGVRGYPTLKFFRNGNPSEYSGGRKADEIVSWLAKKTGPPAQVLATVDEAKTLLDTDKVVVVGFFKDQTSEKAKEFLNAAASIDDQLFAVTSEESLFSEYGAEDENILLFKKFDEEKTLFDGEYTVADIKKFVVANSLPLVVEFNHETAQKIFGGEIKSHLLLFLNKAEDHFAKVTEAARSIAKDFRNDVLFVTIDSSEDDHQRILEFFGMKKEEVPAARLIKLEEDMAKFKPETDELTAESLRTFVQGFLDGKVKQHLLSQELPEDWDKNDVKVLVASNFEEIALNKDKLTLVEFYAPWCAHCQQLVPIYDKVAEHFKDQDDVVIAKMDATINELEHMKIQSFPTIKLYTKENKVIEYNGARTFEGLTKFVSTKGEAESYEETKETEDDDTPRKDEL